MSEINVDPIVAAAEEQMGREAWNLTGEIEIESIDIETGQVDIKASVGGRQIVHHRYLPDLLGWTRHSHTRKMGFGKEAGEQVDEILRDDIAERYDMDPEDLAITDIRAPNLAHVIVADGENAQWVESVADQEEE